MVHAKFQADWFKTVGARGMHTHRQTDIGDRKKYRPPIYYIHVGKNKDVEVRAFSECFLFAMGFFLLFKPARYIRKRSTFQNFKPVYLGGILISGRSRFG